MRVQHKRVFFIKNLKGGSMVSLVSLLTLGSESGDRNWYFSALDNEKFAEVAEK